VVRNDAPILTQRALNRALLARQHLLEFSELSALELIEHLCGLQAQEPYAPYVGVWVRQKQPRLGELADLLVERQAVRLALMRSTVHLVSSQDVWWLRASLQPMIDQSWRNSHAKRVQGVDLQQLAEQSRAMLAEAPLTLSELGKRLQPLWPDYQSADLGYAARTVLTLIQPPPRAIWGQGGQATHTTIEQWLGEPTQAEADYERLVLRYLAAFGPASVRDFQNWSGLTRMKEYFERLAPRLVCFRNEDGIELYDLPEAPRPDPNTPAPIRFLPEFDNLLLGHQDRRRVISDEHRKIINKVPNGRFPSSILIDGFFAGQWRVIRQGQQASVVIELFDSRHSVHYAALAAEGMRLLAYVASDCTQQHVQFGPIYP
jgi:hypothetical protein